MSETTQRPGNGETVDVLFLELLRPDRESNYGATAVPWLQGRMRTRGLRTAWRTLGVSPPDAVPGTAGAHVYGLTEDELTTVLETLDRLDPTFVLTSRKLHQRTVERLRTHRPGLELGRVDHDWPSALRRRLDASGSESSRIVLGEICDAEQPDFDRAPLNERAVSIRPYTQLWVGAECVYRRPLERNRFFQGVDLSECTSSIGCSFCAAPAASADTQPQTDIVELAMSQVRAAERSANPALFHREYQVQGAGLWHRLDDFLPSLLEASLPRSRFFFSVRIDELLAAKATLNRWLPRLAERGHAICLFNIGLESFSETENERFNKGLTTETIDRGIAALRELESRFPETFQFERYGGFGMIVFTPWTRLEDVRANIDGVRRHGLPVTGLLLGSAVQLLSDRAITALARKDGLVIDDFEDHPFDSGCLVEWDQHEVPWRFRNPEVARVFRISRRLARERQEAPRDEEDRTVLAWQKRFESAGGDLLEAFEALVDVAEEGPPQTPISETLDAVRERLGLDFGADPVDDPAQEGRWTAGGGGPPAGAADDPVEEGRWGSLAERLRARAARHPEDPALMGLRLDRCEAIRLDEGRCVELVLSRGQTITVCLRVEPLRDDRRAFLRGASLAISHGAVDGLPFPRLEPLARKVLALAEELLESGDP